MSPKVSIIVPVYQAEAWLERCVTSMVSQTLQEIEIILVEDGSPDRSGLVCDEWERKDARIKVIHKKNEGQGIARNAGLSAAQGEYVMFLDSDDYLEPTACKRLYDTVREKCADLCCFGYVIEDQSKKIVYRAKLTGRTYEKEEIAQHFVLHFFGDSADEDDLRGVSACMTLFRRFVIETYGIRFRSEREFLSEDTIFSLDFCRHIERAVVLPEYFYHYVQNGDSFSHAYRKDRLALTKVLCGVLEEYAKVYQIEDKVCQRIHMVYWVSLMECIKQEIKRDISAEEKDRQIRKMCDEAETQRRIKELKLSKLNLKQRVFWYCIKRKWHRAVILLAGLRNRKGL